MATIPIISQLNEDITHYLENYVVLSITDLKAVPPGSSIGVNINEKWEFKVQIDNNNALSMDNTSLLIRGENGAMVFPNSFGPLFLPEFSTGNSPISVPGHNSVKAGPFYFIAPNRISTVTPLQLVSASIIDYTGSLTHVMVNHTTSLNSPVGKYSALVYP